MFSLEEVPKLEGNSINSIIEVVWEKMKELTTFQLMPTWKRDFKAAIKEIDAKLLSLRK